MSAVVMLWLERVNFLPSSISFRNEQACNPIVFVVNLGKIHRKGEEMAGNDTEEGIKEDERRECSKVDLILARLKNLDGGSLFIISGLIWVIGALFTAIAGNISLTALYICIGMMHVCIGLTCFD